MQQKKSGCFGFHYYPKRLLKKMMLLDASRATIIEAPSGYGKTTAVKDYLKNVAEQDNVYWFTAVDEAPAALYRRLCRVIEKIDTGIGEHLLDIDIPNAFTIGDVCETLRSLECERKTWLIIDNFQFFLPVLSPSFLTALLDHSGEELRIVIITQALKKEFLSAIVCRGLPHITASDLQWETVDIQRYFEMAGVELKDSEALEIGEYTNGWVIAVHLQLCAFKETGVFSDDAVQHLMEHLIWDKLSYRQQDLFMRLSVFETFTLQQMCGVLDCIMLPDYAMDSLSIPFISYVDEYQRYEPHAVFYEMVKTKRKKQGMMFDCECLIKAGDLCRMEGRNAEALAFYARVKDYKKILMLELSQLVYVEIEDITFAEIALDITQNCLIKIWREHLGSMLNIAWAIRLAGRMPEFCALMEKLDVVLPDSGQLRAEWLLLSVYLHFPRLELMIPLVQKAAVMFEGSCSRVILSEAPWAFYEHLQLTAFHIKAGNADREADMLEEFIDTYSELTGGHGKGADALFRAELAYQRCDTAGAEIFAHKAAFIAERSEQKIIQIGVAKLLAEIALLRADAEGWRSAVSAIEHVTSGSTQNTSMFRAVLDVVYGSLLAQFEDFERVPDWLKDDDFINTGLSDSIVRHALTAHILYMAGQGDFTRVIGLMQAVPNESLTVQSECFFSILKTAGYYALGEYKAASVCLERSAKIALADEMLHYFVGFSWKLNGMSDKLIENSYPHLLNIFMEHKEQYLIGYYALSDAISENAIPSGLTKREHEIALLAAEGLRNYEIGEKLFVSENTVRAHLRAIYQKLDIDRRTRLAQKLKQ